MANPHTFGQGAWGRLAFVYGGLYSLTFLDFSRFLRLDHDGKQEVQPFFGHSTQEESRLWLWVKTNGTILGVFGAPPMLVYFSGWIWMFTGRTIWILAHGHILQGSPFLQPRVAAERRCAALSGGWAEGWLPMPLESVPWQGNLCCILRTDLRTE